VLKKEVNVEFMVVRLLCEKPLLTACDGKESQSYQYIFHISLHQNPPKALGVVEFAPKGEGLFLSFNKIEPQAKDHREPWNKNCQIHIPFP
jgi:hypothetical protein